MSAAVPEGFGEVDTKGRRSIEVKLDRSELKLLEDAGLYAGFIPAAEWARSVSSRLSFFQGDQPAVDLALVLEAKPPSRAPVVLTLAMRERQWQAVEHSASHSGLTPAAWLRVALVRYAERELRAHRR